MKLSKAQQELMDQINLLGKMEWDFYGNSPTQFRIKTAQVLRDKGLVKLTYVGKETAPGCNYSINYVLESIK